MSGVFVAGTGAEWNHEHNVLERVVTTQIWLVVEMDEDESIVEIKNPSPGQTKKELTVWRLYIKGTMEEVILREQRRERKAAAAAALQVQGGAL